jgi:hypothetical protein
MTYTINGKEYTEFEINKRCAELGGLSVNTKLELRVGFTKSFHEKYPHTIWCAEIDRYGEQMSAWEQKIFTRDAADAWPIIEKCFDELVAVVDNFEGCLRDGYCTKWDALIKEHNCTKLVAACICFIEINEGGKK